MFSFLSSNKLFIDDMSVFRVGIMNANLVAFRCVNQFKVNVVSGINSVVHLNIACGVASYLPLIPTDVSVVKHPRPPQLTNGAFSFLNVFQLSPLFLLLVVWRVDCHLPYNIL